MGFEIPMNGHGQNNSFLYKDQMITGQKIALDSFKWSRFVKLGKINTPMDSMAVLLWHLLWEAGGKDGFQWVYA